MTSCLHEPQKISAYLYNLHSPFLINNSCSYSIRRVTALITQLKNPVFFSLISKRNNKKYIISQFCSNFSINWEHHVIPNTMRYLIHISENPPALLSDVLQLVRRIQKICAKTLDPADKPRGVGRDVAKRPHSV